MNPNPIQDETTAAAPSTAGMTTKVVKGSLWTLAGQVAPLGVSLFTTPFVIRLLGSEGYGVLILVGLIPTYFAFADLGMGIASTKFASEAYAAGDAKREAATVHTAALMSFVLSIPVAVLIFLFSDTAVGLFNVPEHFRVEANLALKLASVTFVINFLNGIFNTPQLTRLRMDLNTFVSSGFRMLGLIATPITIYLGGGIVGAIAVLLCVSLLTLAANIFVSGKLLREFRTFTIDRTTIRPMLNFGGALAIAGIAGVLLVNLEKVVLTASTSVKNLAFYSVAYTLAGMVMLFSNAMQQSILPAFSQLTASSHTERRQNLFDRILKINIFGMLPILATLFVLARPFFTIWAGDEFGQNSTQPFYMLLLGLYVSLLGYVPVSIIVAVGRTDVLAKLYWTELLPYVGLVFLLTTKFGAIGAATAWSIRVIVETLIILILARKLSSISYAKLSSDFKMIVAALVIFAPALILSALIGTIINISVIVLLVALLIYLKFMWRNVLDVEERKLIKLYLVNRS